MRHRLFTLHADPNRNSNNSSKPPGFFHSPKSLANLILSRNIPALNEVLSQHPEKLHQPLTLDHELIRQQYLGSLNADNVASETLCLPLNLAVISEYFATKSNNSNYEIINTIAKFANINDLENMLKFAQELSRKPDTVLDALISAIETCTTIKQETLPESRNLNLRG